MILSVTEHPWEGHPQKAQSSWTESQSGLGPHSAQMDQGRRIQAQPSNLTSTPTLFPQNHSSLCLLSAGFSSNGKQHIMFQHLIRHLLYVLADTSRDVNGLMEPSTRHQTQLQNITTLKHNCPPGRSLPPGFLRPRPPCGSSAWSPHLQPLQSSDHHHHPDTVQTCHRLH